MDLPKQACITRDNASISLDVLLSYKVVNPKVMVYACQNLPRIMSKVLQAQVRAVAGSLDVDSIIEETATMDRVAGELGAVASRWGVSGTLRVCNPPACGAPPSSTTLCQPTSFFSSHVQCHSCASRRWMPAP